MTWTLLEQRYFSKFTDFGKFNCWQFWVPSILTGIFCKVIEDGAESNDEMLQRFLSVLDARTELSDMTGLGDIPYLTQKILYQVHQETINTIAECFLIGNVIYAELPKDSNGNIGASFFTTEKSKHVEEAFYKQFGLLENEFLIAYLKSNLWGSFQGEIITSHRVVSIGKETVSMPLQEIRSIDTGLWNPKLNGIKTPFSVYILTLLKSFVSFRQISFAILVKEQNGSVINFMEDFIGNAKIRLVLSRIPV